MDHMKIVVSDVEIAVQLKCTYNAVTENRKVNMFFILFDPFLSQKIILDGISGHYLKLQPSTTLYKRRD